jgi:hypothetical protein
MKNQFLVIFISAFLLLISCKNETVNKNLTSKMIFLPSVKLMRGDTNKVNPLLKKIKIFTVIDGSCPTCVDKLIDWEKYIKKIDTAHVGFVILILSEDNFFTFDELNKNYIKFSYPYFYDIKKALSSKNNLLDYNSVNTFLLNSKNEVILTGNPIEKKEIFNQYEIEINKRIKKNNYVHIENEAIFKSAKAEGIKKSNKTQPSVVIQEGVNETIFKISEGFIYKDQNGKILSTQEADNMMSDNNYIPNIDSENGIITFKKR